MTKGIINFKSNQKNKSFEYDIIEYDARNKEYTLKNKVTGGIKIIPRDEVLEMMKQQNRE